MQPQEFEQQIASFRHDFFVDSSNHKYSLKDEYHRKIPADGLNHYLEGIWVSWV